MKKRMMSFLCMFVLLMNLFGCTSDEDIALSVEEEQIELTFSWWGTDNRHDYTIQAVKAFEKEHPNIKVNLEYSEFTGFQLKTDVKMKAHTEADVMQLNYGWLNRYSADGQGLYNLKQLASDLTLNNYSEKTLSYGYSNDVLNALPIALNGKVFMYNKSIYDKYQLDIPDSWEDLFHAAEVMNQDGIYPLDVDRSALWFLAVAYVEQATGKAVIDEQNQFSFSVEDVQRMVEFCMELITRGVIRPVNERADKYIMEGTSAGIVQWVTSTQKYSEYMKQAGGTVAFGDLPVQSGARRTGWYIKPATMYGISVNTAHPKEAAMLLEYLVSSKEMAKLQGLDKGLPSNRAARKVLEAEDMLVGTQYEASCIIDQSDTMLMSPFFEDSALQGALDEACTDVRFGKSDTSTAAAAAYEKMAADLK